MKKGLITGLAAIVLAGTSLGILLQKRKYLEGNVHGVDYSLVEQNDFNKYKLEQQKIFGDVYTFWDHESLKNELNFSISKDEDQDYIFNVGEKVTIDSKKYIPKKIANNIDVANLKIERTYPNEIKIKDHEYFGFSFEINEEDLRFKLPRQEINGIEYIVLKKLDGNLDEKSLDLYYIPFIEGTKIRILNESFEKNGHTISTKISCPENGGVYLPILKSENFKTEKVLEGILDKNRK